MAYTIKKNLKVALKKETTEGTYEAPSSGADFVQALEDGIEVNGAKETLELNTIGTGLSKVSPRVGLESASGSVGVYMKAGSNPTSEPQYGIMMESLLGSKRSLSAPLATGTGHTSSTIQVSDTSELEVGDIVVIKEAGEYHTSPISAVDNNTSIDLLLPAGSAPSDGVEIEAFHTYVPDDQGHPAYSISKYVEDAVLEQAVGCKTTTLSLESFSTGQIASFSMGFEGADHDRNLTPLPFTPSYDTSETPIILDACIWQDGNKIEVNEFTLNVENTLGWLKDTCNGKTTSRITNRTVSGTINPYKEDDSITNFDKFDSNESFSLVITAHNPTQAGEYKESVSFYMPECTITELAEADIDGVLTEAITFNANSVDGTVKELYISVS